MRNLLLILFFAIIASQLSASGVKDFTQDSVRFGKGTAEKSLVFSYSPDATTPKISTDPSDDILDFFTTGAIFGDGAVGDFLISIDRGGNNPAIKWKEADSKFVMVSPSGVETPIADDSIESPDTTNYIQTTDTNTNIYMNDVLVGFWNDVGFTVKGRAEYDNVADIHTSDESFVHRLLLQQTVPMTTEGDIIYRGGSANARLAIGTNGQLLGTNGTIPTWVDPPETSPITTRGDLVTGDASGSPERLALGTMNQILTSDGVDAKWEDAPAGVETYVDNYNFEVDTSNWNTSASQLVIVKNSTTPLKGTGDLRLSRSSSVSLLGEYIYPDTFTLDKGDLAQIITACFYKDMDDADYDDGDLQVKFYDVTASAYLSTLTGEDIPAGGNYHCATFQSPPTNTQIQMRLVTTTASEEWTYLYFDNFSVAKSKGGTDGTYVLEEYYHWYSTALSSSGNYVVMNPANASFSNDENLIDFQDSNRKLVALEDIEVEIAASVVHAAASNSVKFFMYDSSNVGIATITHRDAITSKGVTWVGHLPKGYYIKIYHEGALSITDEQTFVSLKASKHINARISTDYSGREIYFRAKLNNGANWSHSGSPALQVLPFDTAIVDTVSAFDTAADQYIIPESGLYTTRCHARASSGITYVVMGIYGGSGGTSLLDYSGDSASGGGAKSLNATVTRYLVKGDKMSCFVRNFDSSARTIDGSTDRTFFEIFKHASPQSLAERPHVSARATASGQTFTTATISIINFSTVTYDKTAGITTGASWKYSPSVSGTYSVKSSIAFDWDADWGLGDYALIYLYKNGAVYSTIGKNTFHAASATTHEVQGSDSIELTSTDYIDVRVFHNAGGDVNISSSHYVNFINIELIK